MSKSTARKRQQKSQTHRLRITRKKLVESKRRITERNQHKVRDNSAPVMSMWAVRFEIADRTQAPTYGGLRLMHPLAHQCGLVRALDQSLALLKNHFPYHESDHVLNIANTKELLRSMNRSGNRQSHEALCRTIITSSTAA